eukprot:71107-Hanusia_phi.AAC.1
MNSQGSHSTPASPFDNTLNLQALVPSSPLSSERPAPAAGSPGASVGVRRPVSPGRDAGTAGSGSAACVRARLPR